LLRTYLQTHTLYTRDGYTMALRCSPRCTACYIRLTICRVVVFLKKQNKKFKSIRYYNV